MSARDRLTSRRKDFKKNIDASEIHRKRHEYNVELRKNKREEAHQKKRNMGAVLASSSGTPGVSVPFDVQAQLAELPQMFAQVMSEDATAQYEGTRRFRKLLSIEHKPPIDQVLSTNVVPRFVQFLTRVDNPALQFEAAWALTNIASGTDVHTKAVMGSGAVPIFCQLLSSPADDVREQAVWALGNIAGEGPDCRNAVLDHGAMEALLEILKPEENNAKLSLLRNATWTVSNLCRGKPQPDFNKVRIALPVLAHLIFTEDDEILTDACWALSYLSDGDETRIDAVIESGVAYQLIRLLMHPETLVKVPALRTVGNIVTGDDRQTQVIINCSGLPCLNALLTHHKKSIRKEACWTISNITAGNQSQIQQVIEHNIIAPLINILQNAEYDIRKEAAWAISNATSGGSPEQIHYLVTQGCIKPLCDLLDVPDGKIITVALEGLANILKAGALRAQSLGMPDRNEYAQYIEEANGLNKLFMLQGHGNQNVYAKVYKIIETYFGDMTEENEELAPAVNAETNQFDFAGVETPQGGFQFN